MAKLSYNQDLRNMETKLRNWQLKVIDKLFKQDDRDIMWVYVVGGKGKTFLGHILSACYGFDLLDGVTSTRDVCSLLIVNVRGIVFDVTHSGASHFALRST